MNNRARPNPGFLKGIINGLIRREYHKKRGILPLYWRIPLTSYELAIWSSMYQDPLGDLRITIRHHASGEWLATIKAGDYSDPVRVSRHFRPLGLNLQKILCRDHAVA
jgi:hypothetical protein